MGAKRIVPDFHAPDPQASRRFYEEVIGLETVMDQGWIVTLAATGSATPQISLVSRDATAPVDADVSIEVEDVDEVHAKAKQFGSEIVHPLTDEPWGVRRFFVRGPDGQVVNVLEHKS